MFTEYGGNIIKNDYCWWVRCCWKRWRVEEEHCLTWTWRRKRRLRYTTVRSKNRLSNSLTAVSLSQYLHMTCPIYFRSFCWLLIYRIKKRNFAFPGGENPLWFYGLRVRVVDVLFGLIVMNLPYFIAPCAWDSYFLRPEITQVEIYLPNCVLLTDYATLQLINHYYSGQLVILLRNNFIDWLHN